MRSKTANRPDNNLFFTGVSPWYHKIKPFSNTGCGRKKCLPIFFFPNFYYIGFYLKKQQNWLNFRFFPVLFSFVVVFYEI
jgi:hypothetical protein